MVQSRCFWSGGSLGYIPLELWFREVGSSEFTSTIMRGGGILLDVWELGLEVPHNTSLHNTLAISSLLVPHRCKGVETGYFPINPRRNEMMGWVQMAVFAWKVSQHSDLITQTDESQDFIRRWYRYSKLLVAPQGRAIHPCHTDARLGCMTCGAPLCRTAHPRAAMWLGL